MDAEEEIENLRSEQKKKKYMLEKNQMEIASQKKEIQRIQNEITGLNKDIANLSEGNTNQVLYQFKQYGKNDKLEYREDSNLSNSHETAFHNVSNIDRSGELKAVLAGEFSGELWHLVYIEQDYYIVPKDAKNLQEMCYKDFISSEGRKYRAQIDGERWAFNLGVKAQPDRKKMVYSIKTSWQQGSTIPWFKISHDLPNMDLNEATILNKLAEIDAKIQTTLRKGEDIKEMEKENNSLLSQIEFKEQEIIQHQKKIQEVKKQQGLEHIKDQIISLNKYIEDSKSEMQQIQKYIQLIVEGIISEQQHISKKKIELLDLEKQRLHYAIIIKCKIEIAHLLREFAKISINGLGIDKKNIDCNLIPSLESYSKYYDININNIKKLCEETLISYKINRNKS